MAKNIKYSEPPTFRGNIEGFLNEVSDYLRTVHQDIYGLGGDGGQLDGENITSIDDPGVADGTGAGNATVINNLVSSFKTLGTIDS